ncbi:FKBP-type peptidyl-prolyl cis-trans isomerase [soil metagenome]
MKKLQLLFLTAIVCLLSACLDSTGPDVDEYDNTPDLEFLEENANREGVTVTESGLQYRVIEDAEGAVPTDDTAVVLHFIGTFVDGSEFNNSYEQEQPSMLQVAELLSGLREGIQLMNVGAIYEFVLPADLAYGNNPPQGIPPGATLIYEVELVHDNSLDPIFLKENAEEEGVEVTESGLQYKVLEEGDGDTPDPDSVVNVEYTGTFIYGETFDTSRNTDNPATFNAGEVIAGFSEGLQLMQEGARYELYLPASLAYGTNPPQGIYPGATLIFDVELISISDQ